MSNGIKTGNKALKSFRSRCNTHQDFRINTIDILLVKLFLIFLKIFSKLRLKNNCHKSIYHQTAKTKLSVEISKI